MVKIVFIKDFNGIKRGTECEISDHYCNEHIKAGNAVLASNWHEAEMTEPTTEATAETEKPKHKKSKSK
jgi:hypothetical protein